MNPLFQFWQAWGGTLIGLLLVVVSVAYFVRFVLPGWQLDRHLQYALNTLRRVPAEYTQGSSEKQLGDSFRSPALKTLWLSYAATLQGPLANTPHPWQATLAAEQVFQRRNADRQPLENRFLPPPARHPDRHRHHRHLLRPDRRPQCVSGEQRS